MTDELFFTSYFHLLVDSYPYCGQNLAIVGQSKGFKEFREAYQSLHDKWFVEHEFCDMNNIRKFENKPIKAG